MQSFDTLSEAIETLRGEGYVEDFNLQQDGIVCEANSYKLAHDEFHIVKFFRFEDNTDPSDQSILYAISSSKYQLKGVLINGYGIYSDGIANELLEKLKV